MSTDHHLSKRCTVNAAYLDTWHEAGLQRRRTAFSAAGTLVELFCNFWSTFLPSSLILPIVFFSVFLVNI